MVLLSVKSQLLSLLEVRRGDTHECGSGVAGRRILRLRRLPSCDVRGARLARFAPQRGRQRRDQSGDGAYRHACRTRSRADDCDSQGNLRCSECRGPATFGQCASARSELGRIWAGSPTASRPAASGCRIDAATSLAGGSAPVSLAPGEARSQMSGFLREVTRLSPQNETQQFLKTQALRITLDLAQARFPDVRAGNQ